MLVLTRKKGEAVDLIFNDQTISVKLIKINGCQAVLGFDAPLDVNIVRQEINGRSANKGKQNE